MADLPAGLYESLLSKNLQDLLDSRPELRSIFAKIESDEEPARYAAFVAKLVEKALRLETDSEIRLQLCNAVIERLAAAAGGEFLSDQYLLPTEKPVLLEITPTRYLQPGMPRPETSLSESSLFTG